MNELSQIARKVLEKYDNKRLPVIVNPKAGRSDNKSPEKKKYLVPADMPWAQFQTVLRKRISGEEATRGLVINVQKGNRNYPIFSNPCTLMNAIYNEHKSDDGFLYLYYTQEATYG